MGYTLADMAPLEYEQQRGREAREAILDAVERMERAGERPTTTVLARRVGLSRSALSHHVGILIEQGYLRTVMGRKGGVYLTEAGREARGV